MPDLPLIDEELAAFLQGGVSMHVASSPSPSGEGRGEGHQPPGLARPLGCRVSSDRSTVTVLLLASHAATMLADFRANGRIAVVFSRPTTHRTVQLKGTDARAQAPSPEDARVVGRYRQAFVDELASLGYDTTLPRTLLAGAQDELVAVSFTPTAAFEQTPGPGAGTSLKAP